MKKKNMLDTVADDDTIPAFDFSQAVHKSYAAKYKQGVTVTVHTDGSDRKLVELDADVSKSFRSAKSVNQALRGVIKARKSKAKTKSV